MENDKKWSGMNNLERSWQVIKYTGLSILGSGAIYKLEQGILTRQAQAEAEYKAVASDDANTHHIIIRDKIKIPHDLGTKSQSSVISFAPIHDLDSAKTVMVNTDDYKLFEKGCAYEVIATIKNDAGKGTSSMQVYSVKEIAALTNIQQTEEIAPASKTQKLLQK